METAFLPVMEKAEPMTTAQEIEWSRAGQMLYAEGECQVFCVWVIGSMLSERSKDNDDFRRTAGRAAEGLQAA